MHDNAPLRIAVPTEGDGGADAARSAHFGHAASFTVLEVAGGEVSDVMVIRNPPHEHGGCGLTVQMLADAGVRTAIVVGMGRGPLAAMASLGMTALFDDQSPTPRLAVEAYLAGRADEFGGQHVCSGH